MFNKLRRFILTIGYPFIILVGRIPWIFKVNRKCKAKEVRKVQTLIYPGMVLLSYKRLEPSNFLFALIGMRTKYTHAALVIDSNTVIESTKDGVHLTDIIDFITTKDYIAVLNPNFLSSGQKKLAAEYSKMHLGKPYDYKFIWTNSKNLAFYCSELVWDAYYSIVKDNPFKPRYTLGEMTVKPDDIYNAKSKFNLLYEFRGK